MSDDAQEDLSAPRGNGVLFAYRLGQLEKNMERIQEEIRGEHDAMAAFRTSITTSIKDMGNVVDRLDADKITRVIEAAEGEQRSKAEIAAQLRNTALTLVFVGIIGPIVVLVLSHYVFR